MRRRLPLIILGVVAVMYGVLIVTQPAPMDWRPDYEGDSARPLGADVLRAMLPQALAPAGGQPAFVRDVEQPPFLHLGVARGDTTYVFVTHAFEPDEAEARRLLRHADAGATVFIATRALGGSLAEALGSRRPSKHFNRAGLRVEWRGRSGTLADSTLQLAASSHRLAGGYRFPFPVGDHHLAGLDSTSTEVIAFHSDTEKGSEGRPVDVPVVARIRYGRGSFVVSSTPDAFANAALMGADGRPTDAPAFVSGVLAYLPAGPAFWDEYVKPRRGAGASPLRFVLERPPLRLAYLLTAFGVLAYIVFRGRRWQRPIPVVAPPPNAAVEFVRTLGRLHFQHGDHRALVERRARYAVDRMRTRLGVTDADLTPATEERLVRRGLPEEVVVEAFRRMSPPAGPVEAGDVVALDRALERLWDEAT